MLTAIDKNAFHQFIQMILNIFLKDVLWKPSHNKLLFSIKHAELFDPIFHTLLLC